MAKVTSSWRRGKPTGPGVMNGIDPSGGSTDNVLLAAARAAAAARLGRPVGSSVGLAMAAAVAAGPPLPVSTSTEAACRRSASRRRSCMFCFKFKEQAVLQLAGGEVGREAGDTAAAGGSSRAGGARHGLLILGLPITSEHQSRPGAGPIRLALCRIQAGGGW